MTPQYGQQRKSDVGRNAAVVIMLVFNIATVIWGAAKAVAALDNLKEAITDLNTTTKAMSIQVYDHDARLRLLERTNGNR